MPIKFSLPAGQITILQKRHLEAASLYEYTLGHLQFAGQNGQIRTLLSLQEEFANVMARVESLRGRMSEAKRQVEGLFESLLTEALQ